MSVGPDAARYLHLGARRPVPRPFNTRIGLPMICGTHMRRWWIVWALSWPVAAVSMFAWQSQHGWQRALAATVLLMALPGIQGPAAVMPVGVDLPALALTLAAVASRDHSMILFAVLLALAAVCKETAPICAALWMWSLLPLAALAAPAIVAAACRPGPDPLGPKYQEIADHPIRASLAHHRGRWRDGWLMVAPWGVCLAALYRPTWQVVVVLAVAYGILLVATDTVRLYQHAAGPVMAAAAAQVVPVRFLAFAVILHVAWWVTPERV